MAKRKNRKPDGVPPVEEPTYLPVFKDHVKDKEEFIKYYAELPIIKLAAAWIGKDEDTIHRWKKKDAGFADQIKRARSWWAIKNVSQVRSREWLLERVMKSHFAEKKEVDHNSSKIDELLERASKLLPESGK